jgi:hypothetical protein
VCVAKSNRFKGAVDTTYITKSQMNDSIGETSSTLTKHGVIFGKSHRQVRSLSEQSFFPRKSLQVRRDGYDAGTVY